MNNTYLPNLIKLGINSFKRLCYHLSYKKSGMLFLAAKINEQDAEKIKHGFDCEIMKIYTKNRHTLYADNKADEAKSIIHELEYQSMTCPRECGWRDVFPRLLLHVLRGHPTMKLDPIYTSSASEHEPGATKGMYEQPI